MKFYGILLLSICCFTATAQKPAAKKTPKPAPKTVAPPKKSGGPEASIISITVEHNGEKTELFNTQFETWVAPPCLTAPVKRLFYLTVPATVKKMTPILTGCSPSPRQKKARSPLGSGPKMVARGQACSFLPPPFQKFRCSCVKQAVSPSAIALCRVVL